ncbi:MULTISPECIES: type IV secretory system conjugative DNA transfer family protein [unclassified Coleofasciculus]|uniref:type IV secretory system conjugative DNA transfer family protein n=1 Tax=unclassified Coleofasciculus TaxID=2692782 RepID=UPI0018824B0D|nr:MULTISPECIES: type IV secretion system DNA-binding domain-containing protein [unclassified Coleofasciculus]MBE9124751.1 type IV secretory system conjugative DNA transfer family protein [Coleofasciculus sp. LEGE 07081]MBE9148203.1 type IV secretory system conjugative DNA transfer family protein [Coleofasciculus sp. LEGE 07092]
MLTFNPILATAQEEQDSSPVGIDPVGLLKQFNNPEGYMMLFVFLVLLILSRFAGSSSKITSGRIAGGSEKLAATNKAIQQRRARTNKVTLWCGEPRYWLGGKLKNWSARIQALFGQPSTLWLPDMQRSMLVIGQPGSGKSFSTIDPAIESAMQQGLPILLYDKKGDQLQLHGSQAARYGYKIYVFAPGEKYSDSFNIFNYLTGPEDGTMAGEIASVINANAQKPGEKGDAFFSKAGALLSKALIQLVKSYPDPHYHDLAMLYGIIRLPDLVERLDYGVQSGRINQWVATSFNQFLSAKHAKKTISGILTTASATFSSFIQRDLLPSLMGASSIPPKIEGKTLVVFKLDDERRHVVGPVVAAAIHMMVVKNLSFKRQEGLIVSLDELPSIRLSNVPQWVNEYRSNGGCFILGIQSLQQLYEGYGDKMGKAIASACSTHVLFNPGTNDTAKQYSERYGDKEVTHKTKSTSHSKGSRSTSWSEHRQKVPLFTIDQILGLPQGRCIVSNPAYGSFTRTLVPYPLKILIPNQQIERWHKSEALWDEQVRPALEQRQAKFTPTEEELLAAIEARIEIARQWLPMPPDDEESGKGKASEGKENSQKSPQEKQDLFSRYI